MGKAVRQIAIGGALIGLSLVAPFAGATFGKFLLTMGMSGLRYRDRTGAVWTARGARLES